MPGSQTTNPPAKAISADEFVDARIRQTRLAVKSADLATGLVTLLAGLLVLLLIAAIADHWIVRGGLNRWERMGLFAIGGVAAVWYIGLRLAPMALRAINPLYAAREIERESPELKNSLVNSLQLRGQAKSPAQAAVLNAVGRQAADRLAATGDAPIDHTPLLRAAKVLLVLVALLGVYIVASPKDFFASAARLLAPWAEIAPPSRVQIEEVTPGAIEVDQGQQIEISASVFGLREDEFPEVVFSTADGAIVNRRLAMRAERGGLRHTTTLPPGGSAAALGLQGNLTYRIEAGDGRTRNYRVEVRPAASIAPTSLRYEYPAYTGRPPYESSEGGDIRAIEGTRVTINAQASLPIESAEIDLRADGRPDARMQVEDRQATGQLLLLRSDRSTPTSYVTDYVLRFASIDDRTNADPPRYRLEVVADLPPEASIVTPEEPKIDVALDERVTIEIEARDPDFALKSLRLVGETDSQRKIERELLRNEQRGRVTRSIRFTPAEIGLQPGQVLDYWVEASDIRTPKANQTQSARQQIRVVGPQRNDANPPDGDPQEAAGESQPENAGESSPRGGGESGEAGQEQSPQQNGEQPPGAEGQQQRSQDDQEQGDQQQQQQQQQQPPGGGIQAPGESGEQSESSDDNSPGAEGSANGQDESSGAQSGGEQSPEANSDAAEQTDSSRDQGAGGPTESSEEQNSGGQPEEAEPVARDGSDDGAAFRRIQEYLENQRGSEGDESGNDNSKADREETTEQGQTDDSPSGQPSSESQTAQPRDSTGEAQAERPEEGPGAGEQDRRGDQSDSTTSESGGDTPPGQQSDPTADPREGTGSSGQNQAADRGAGQSADRGPGESSGQSGDQQQADRPTGDGGKNETGQGEGAKSSPTGDKPGSEDAGGSDEQPGESSDADPSNGEPTPGDQGNQREAGAGEQSSGEGNSGSSSGDSPSDQQPNDQLRDLRDQGDQSSGAQSGEEQGEPAGIGDRGATEDGPGAGTEIGGDEANLDYAREQTELVLERLEEKLAEQEVDRELLEELGWTEQDLRRFLQRWRGRAQDAKRRGPEGQTELDRALRSLGLNESGPSTARDLDKDTLRDLRERTRTKTPPRLRGPLEWYNRSLHAIEGDDTLKE